MCVIILAAPGASLNKDNFFNAVWNNPHGFGLVIKQAGKKLKLIKNFYAEGTDPEMLWGLMEQYKDHERMLHVRWTTKGASNLDNTQPFLVYSDDDRDVYFAHNGTLTGFGTGGFTTYSQHHQVQPPADAISDTREFSEKILAPALEYWCGKDGIRGNYSSGPFYKMIVDKHWASGSTGIFISNDLPILRIGSGWSEYKHPNDSSSGEVWVSNTSYFDRLQRGFMFQKREADRKAAEERAKAAEKGNEASGQDLFLTDETGNNNAGSIAIWNTSGFSKSPKVLEAVEDLVTRWDLDDPTVVSTLGHVTYEEWVEYITNEEPFTLAALFQHFALEFRKVFVKANLAERKHKRATETIAKMKNEGLEQNAA